ncbi:MAG: hypothetical protein V2A34_15180 [Lentisphaerota bacterium]
MTTTRHRVVAAKLAGCAMLMAAVVAAGCDRAGRDGSLNRQQVGARKPARVLAAKPSNAPPAAVTAPVDRTQEWETREARMASVKLAEQVAELRKELEEARGRIEELTGELAKAKLESDRTYAEQSAAAPEKVPSGAASGNPMTRGEIRLLDVNEDLNLVVLDVGGVEGIKAGMRFSVMRQSKIVGRVRVVDVRDQIAGAVVEDILPGKNPRKGDQAVMWSGE